MELCPFRKLPQAGRHFGKPFLKGEASGAFEVLAGAGSEPFQRFSLLEAVQDQVYAFSYQLLPVQLHLI